MKVFLVIISIFCCNFLFSQTKNNLIYDTTTTAIIEFDARNEYLQLHSIDSNFKQSFLIQSDFKIIDSLLRIMIIEMKIGDTSKLTFIDIHNKENFQKEVYQKQFVPYKNSDNNRFVFVNIFSESVLTAHLFYAYRKNLRIIADGGNCCFRFKINLTTKQYFDLEVNDIGG